MISLPRLRSLWLGSIRVECINMEFLCTEYLISALMTLPDLANSILLLPSLTVLLAVVCDLYEFANES